MGSKSVDGVPEAGWFEFYDDTVLVDPSSASDRAFLAGLRTRAISRAWPCDPDDTWAHHAIDDDQQLLRVGVWVDVWLTFGVEFDGSRIVGDAVYHEIPFNIERRTEAGIDHSGAVKFLVEQAAVWFEWLLSWPIERGEWDENGVLYTAWASANAKRKLATQHEPPAHRPPESCTLFGGARRKAWWGLGKPRGK